ncbi:hypothetical protein HanRHA438_Chr09g0408731 [Helianthus annuus]|nr:hypothetical protein HanHA300_Chr09g0325691 [Helianthus annuus]KAJ0543058.1 hypothetical protein HanHA89_Chr09g0346621 [Helianthus annuus]KAJ0708111.1 hypothetical protein HanLR1_Chr09g0325931 [Helianthus annuus]KAJ0889051.1 hypothetical protein HanRHA438_Chr09g0408731 [Helianthus annuus]
MMFLIFWVLMMMFDDVLEDIDLSLVSFYKSVFDFLEDDVLDFLDFLGFDDDVLEDTDLSLVSFYKSMMFLIFWIFWVLMMKFDDVLEDEFINY